MTSLLFPKTHIYGMRFIWFKFNCKILKIRFFGVKEFIFHDNGYMFKKIGLLDPHLIQLSF